MEVTGLKHDFLLKTGQKASRLRIVGTAGSYDKKRVNPILNDDIWSLHTIHQPN